MAYGPEYVCKLLTLTYNGRIPVDSPYGIFWGDTLIPKEIEKIPIIENFLYEKDVLCIKSKEGVGKSILAQQLIFNLTTGTDFLDTYHITKPYTVLWIQTEGDREETFERISNMKKALEIDHSQWAHMFLSGASMNTPRGMKEVMDIAKKPDIKWDVIIIDPLYTTIQGPLTKDEVVSDWVRNVREMKGAFGNPALIILHHENKSFYHEGKEVDRRVGSVFGAFGWGAFFNTIYRFSEKGGVHTLTMGKDRGAKTSKKIEMKLIEPSPLLFVSDDTHLSIGSVVVSTYIRERDSVTRREIIRDNSQFSESTVDRAIAQLKENGTLERFKDDGQVRFRWV